MQFKIDENIHFDAALLLRSYGHDAATVQQQGLRGSPDRVIAKVCRDEGRALVTLDTDFSDVRVYPPNEYSGIIVLKLESQNRSFITNALKRLIPLLKPEILLGRLWIVDSYRVRIRGE